MLRHYRIWIVAIIILSLTVVFADMDLNQNTNGSLALTTTVVANNPDEFEVLYENEHFVFSFKESRDVLSIYDKRNDYTWKSGLDIASSKAVKAALRKEEPLGYEPLEQKMNTTFTALANSLITVEYYDDSLGIKRLSSDEFSKLSQVDGEEDHYVLDINYTEIDIQLRVHIMFTEDGYDLQVLEEEITGSDQNVLAAILLNPFMGASGGMYALYDEETGKHGDVIKKPETLGYVLVPDGPGALIEFSDYNVSMKQYSSKVYGENLSKDTYQNIALTSVFVPLKNPLMPVYGIAHTAADAAFVGYASEGDAFMEIVVVPEENTTLYTWAYPRFEYNQSYYQVFNKRGEGFFNLYEESNSFDIDFHYNFLANTDDQSADYVGMAKSYKEYLLEAAILVEKPQSKDVPIRIDFVMSDQKKSVIGYENVVTTTAENVSEILTDLKDSGINAISSGLLGWQDGGITIGQPWDADWERNIGSKKDFRETLTTLDELDIDVSFVQDYLRFNKEQGKFNNNAIKHINSWYLTAMNYEDVPFDEFYYIKPSTSVEWLEKQIKELNKVGIKSHTITGITSSLLTDHGREEMLEDEVISTYQDILQNISEELKLNLNAPNQYLWAYTDRFLQAPVFSSQYLIEKETVPFLTMVLNGIMDVHAPYSNFSFSETKDILNMIDYNIYPSFVLTEEASYLLSTTNSLDYYSTEYDQYKELIIETYKIIENALTPVRNAQWVNREMISEDVVLNQYDNGVEILINYHDSAIEYKGKTVKPLSYKVFY